MATLTISDERAKELLTGAWPTELNNEERDSLRSQLASEIDRMKCLRGEYEPPYHSKVWGINPNGSEESIFSADFIAENAKDLIPQGYRFFPSRELREEYKTIQAGEWHHKKGDACYPCTRNRLKVSPNGAEDTECADADSVFDKIYHCFPSIKQRDEFISRNKPKEPDAIAEFKKGLPDQKEWTRIAIIGAFSMLSDILESQQKQIASLSLSIEKLEQK